MTLLEKLKSKLGGLVKLGAGSGAGTSWSAHNSSWAPSSPGDIATNVGTSISNSSDPSGTGLDMEPDIYDSFDDEQKQHIALDEQNRGSRLVLPRSLEERYDRLPYGPAKVPTLWPTVQTGNQLFHGPNVANNLNNPNPYLRTKSPADPGVKNRPGSMFDAMRMNTIDTGRLGTLTPGARPPGVTAPGSWSEFTPDPHAVSSADQSRLNAKFMFRKPHTGSGPNLVRNTTGHRIKSDPATGKEMHQFADPVQAWNQMKVDRKKSLARNKPPAPPAPGQSPPPPPPPP